MFIKWLHNTDGVTEAENVKKELFGEDRLLACFENVDSMRAQQIIDTITKSVEAFVDGHSQFDDMTMLCFKLK